MASSLQWGFLLLLATLVPVHIVGLVVPLKSMLYRLGLPLPDSPVAYHSVESGAPT
jgi:hypothetical protein